MNVTVEISTKNRYETLSHALQSVISQTFKPERLIIWDDSDNPIDLRQNNIFFNLFKTLDLKGIKWEVLLGPRMGQVTNHQSTINIAKTEWIWRLDDDNIAEANCLEKLMETVEKCEFKDKLGAVAGCVLHPSVTFHKNATSGLIADSNFKYASQFAKFEGIKNVEHLYSTFLFRKNAAKHGYCKELSRVGHREETIFTYEMKLAGWQLLVNGDAVTYHWQCPTGGIRTYNNVDYWTKDQKIFENKLQKWGVNLNKYKFIYLNNGIGDHYAFRKILPEIKEKYKDHKIIISACYEHAFFDEKDVEIIDLNSGNILAHGDVGKYDVYEYCFKNNLNKPISEAFKLMYL